MQTVKGVSHGTPSIKYQKATLTKYRKSTKTIEVKRYNGYNINHQSLTYLGKIWLPYFYLHMVIVNFSSRKIDRKRITSSEIQRISFKLISEGFKNLQSQEGLIDQRT